MGGSNLISCLFDFVFGWSTSAVLLALLGLPALLQEVPVGHEGFFGGGLGFGFDPLEGFGFHSELQLLSPSFNVGFEPGSGTEHLPVLPPIYVLLGYLPFRRIIGLHIEPVERRILSIVNVFERI